MIRLLLVDDQPILRRVLRMHLALEPDMSIIGEAGDGAEALALAQALHPDVIVMDVVMPGVDGITATQALRAREPAIAVVMLSMYDDAATRLRARIAGAAAFIGKHEPTDVLVQAIRNAAQQKGKPP
jgi:DNA-binding NarL/FixJ family response regulator